MKLMRQRETLHNCHNFRRCVRHDVPRTSISQEAHEYDASQYAVSQHLSVVYEVLPDTSWVLKDITDPPHLQDTRFRRSRPLTPPLRD